ncbi:MAG: TatD family hydrolase [Phycisphaerae bacterium]|nr:TatD family hydrolase [Phycisphaerae bacterium]
MIDTHCHLTFPEFAGKVPEVVARAAEHGVGGAITISTTTRDCLAALAVAKAHPNVWCTAGVHPLYSDEGPHEWENLRLVASDPRCVAWGELGLDNHYSEPGAEVQRRVLAEQLGFIESAHEGGGGRPAIDLPVVIHCREAFADLLPILRRTRLDPSRFVFHCFTGTADEARRVLDFGAMISFTGVVTYRNAPEVREAAGLVPIERIMVETDAPYLSPDPHRGVRPCEPWMASVTARRLAEIKGMEWEDFCRAIDENTRRFFGVEA